MPLGCGRCHSAATEKNIQTNTQKTHNNNKNKQKGKNEEGGIVIKILTS